MLTVPALVDPSDLHTRPSPFHCPTWSHCTPQAGPRGADPPFWLSRGKTWEGLGKANPPLFIPLSDTQQWSDRIDFQHKMTSYLFWKHILPQNQRTSMSFNVYSLCFLIFLLNTNLWEQGFATWKIFLKVIFKLTQSQQERVQWWTTFSSSQEPPSGCSSRWYNCSL